MLPTSKEAVLILLTRAGGWKAPILFWGNNLIRLALIRDMILQSWSMCGVAGYGGGREEYF